MNEKDVLFLCIVIFGLAGIYLIVKLSD